MDTIFGAKEMKQLADDDGYDPETIDWQRLSKDWNEYFVTRPIGSETIEDSYYAFLDGAGGMGTYVIE